MMPSQTRAQQCQAFNHILDNVLEHGDGSTLKVALLASGFDTMRDLMGIRINQIVNLGYTTTSAPTMAASSGGADESKDEEEAGPSTPGPLVTIYVVPSDQNLIHYLRAYWHHRHATGSSIEDWNTVTQEEFDAFQSNPDINIESLEATRAPNIPSTYTITGRTPRHAPLPYQSTLAEIFRCGIKRNQSLFPNAGGTQRAVKMANVSYTVSLNQQKATTHLLVDRGANEGVAGNDVHIIFKTNRTVDIRGIDNHQETDIDIGTVVV
jgi:hypothetical protein